MYIEQAAALLETDDVCIYYEWYERQKQGELYITQHDTSDNYMITDAEYLGYGSVASIRNFAEHLPDNTRWEEIEFLWNVYQAELCE